MNCNNKQTKNLDKELTELDVLKDIQCEELELNLDDDDNIFMEWLLWCYDDTYKYAGDKSGVFKEAGVSYDDVINNDDNFMNMYLWVKKAETGSFEPTIMVYLDTEKGCFVQPLRITTEDSKKILLDKAEAYITKEDNMSMEDLFTYYEEENLKDEIFSHTNDSVKETADYINGKVRNDYYTENKFMNEIIVQQDLFNRLVQNPQPLYQNILNEYKNKKFSVAEFQEIYDKCVDSLIKGVLHSEQYRIGKEQLANIVFDKPFNDLFSFVYDDNRCANGVVLFNYINVSKETLVTMLDYLYDYYPIVAEKLNNKYDYNIQSKDELISFATNKDVIAECKIDFTRPDSFNICVCFGNTDFSIILPAVISSEELPDAVKTSIIEAANENIRDDNKRDFQIDFANVNTLSEMFAAVNEHHKNKEKLLTDKISVKAIDSPDITQDAEGTVGKKYTFSVDLPDEIKEDYISRFGIFSYNGSPNETEHSCMERNKDLINRFELTLTMNVIYTKEPCSTISLQARLHNGIPKYDDGSCYVSKGGGVEEDGFDASTLAVYDFTGYVPLSLNEQQIYKEKAEKAINKMNERLQKQNKYR